MSGRKAHSFVARSFALRCSQMLGPKFVQPMLATLVRTLPEGPQWEYELKLDGYRLQAVKHEDKLRLYSRRGSDFAKKFARIATAVSKIRASSVVLDGEAVAVDEQGKPSFQMLQNRASLPAGWGEGVTADEMKDYFWLHPQVVADIGFAEWTIGGVLRHAEFVALREDKLPREVLRWS